MSSCVCQEQYHCILRCFSICLPYQHQLWQPDSSLLSECSDFRLPQLALEQVVKAQNHKQKSFFANFCNLLLRPINTAQAKGTWNYGKSWGLCADLLRVIGSHFSDIPRVSGGAECCRQAEDTSLGLFTSHDLISSECCFLHVVGLLVRPRMLINMVTRKWPWLN